LFRKSTCSQWVFFYYTALFSGKKHLQSAGDLLTCSHLCGRIQENRSEGKR